MAGEMTNWAIDDEQATGSDHDVIRFQIQSLHPDLEFNTQEPRLNWRKTNWDKFSKTLKHLSTETQPLWQRHQSQPSANNLDAWATLLRDIIKKAAESSTPYLNVTPRSKRWWTEEISTARTVMKQARRCWKRT
jgi:hypothetical protein